MNNQYEIILYWSKEDKSIIAEVPELAGCMANGKTYGEALENVQTIISERIETARSLGRVIPEPKGRVIFSWFLTLDCLHLTIENWALSITKVAYSQKAQNFQRSMFNAQHSTTAVT